LHACATTRYVNELDSIGIYKRNIVSICTEKVRFLTPIKYWLILLAR
jgi:hypothetical protein